MTIKVSDRFLEDLGELRYQPVLKWVRVSAGTVLVADTRAPVLVWEPRRVVPSYAVPASDVLMPLVPTRDLASARTASADGTDAGPPVLDPRIPFAVHTAPGEVLSVELPDDVVLDAVAYRLDDTVLAQHFILDFAAFDWLEEDEPIVGHPRDPYHRIDVRRSSRPIRIEHDGAVLAETDRAQLLFEGDFPFVRYYLPREDVQVELVPSELHTTCAYKGAASHWSVPGSDALRDIAWSYEQPLEDAIAVGGLVSFYTERLDVWVDGEQVPKQETPWSRRHDPGRG